jgi:hypothetical protein
MLKIVVTNLSRRERSTSLPNERLIMNFTKNIGMLLLALYLILAGNVARLRHPNRPYGNFGGGGGSLYFDRALTARSRINRFGVVETAVIDC